MIRLACLCCICNHHSQERKPTFCLPLGRTGTNITLVVTLPAKFKECCKWRRQNEKGAVKERSQTIYLPVEFPLLVRVNRVQINTLNNKIGMLCDLLTLRDREHCYF